MSNWKSNGFLMFKQLCVCFILVFLAPVTKAAFDGSAPVVLKSEPSDVILEQVSISDGNGDTWIAWIDSNGANNDQIIISKINDVGTITRADTIVASSPQTLSSLVLAVDEADTSSLYLAWTDNNNGGVVGNPSLFVARFTLGFGSGVVQWKKEITPSEGGAKENPDLVIADSDPIVAWADSRSGIPRIHATRLSKVSGTTIWSDRAVTTSDSNNQKNVSLAVGTDDIDLFVGFTSEGDNEIILIAKLLVDVGTPLGTQFVKVALANTIALSPLLIANINGGFFVAWHEGEHLQPVSIYLAQFNSVFTPVIGSGWVKVADTGKDKNSVHYKMTSDGADGAVLTWIDGRNSSDDVYASKINSLMQPLWGTSGVRVTDSGTNFSVSSPSIVADSVEGAFVSYSRASNNSSARQARVNYIAPNTSSDPIGGFPSTSAGGSAILQPGTVNLVETTNGVVVSYVGTEPSAPSPVRVLAQVFSGSISPSRIETPIAQSPMANASLLVNTAFTLSASDFIMAGGGTSHTSSFIEIIDSDDIVVMSPQFNGASADFNISQTLASNLLADESYSWRVSYTTITGETSALSAPATFSVVAANANLPSIKGLVNQSIDLTLGDTEASQSFSLADPVGNVDEVEVTATSSDQSRVADSAITINGSGDDRSITVSPTTGGTVTITVTATTSGGLTVSSQYDVSVVSAAVVSGGVSDREILLGETTTLTFTIIDGDLPSLAGLEVAFTISDISVIPTSGFIINPPTVLNGPTTIDITPLKLGVADITLSMTDSDGHLTTEQFKLTVVNELTTTIPSSGGGSVGFMFFLMFFVIRIMQTIKRPRLVAEKGRRLEYRHQSAIKPLNNKGIA